MNSKQSRKVFAAFLTAISFQLLVPHLAFTQYAYVPYKGTGNYSVSFQNYFTSEHFAQDGHRFDVGHITESAMIQEVEYGLTHRLALDLALPFVWSKYNGGYPHVSPGNTLDDGTYHQTFQDFRFSARYQFVSRPLIIIPFIQGNIPSHDYEIFAHSNVGYGLKELRLGVAVGRTITRRSAFTVQYAYGIVQETLGVRPNRSTIRSQFQYVVPHSNRRLIVSALEGFQWSHAGLNFPADFSCGNVGQTQCNWQDPEWYHHSQIWKSSFLNLGASVGYTLNKSGSVEITANYLTDVWGESGHVLNRGLGIMVNYNFQTRYYDEKKSLAANNESCGVVCRKCQAIFQPFKRTPTAGR